VENAGKRFIRLLNCPLQAAEERFKPEGLVYSIPLSTLQLQVAVQSLGFNF
jgi:hypothetical protein